MILRDFSCFSRIAADSNRRSAVHGYLDMGEKKNLDDSNTGSIF
jgi:hypothetical protein